MQRRDVEQEPLTPSQIEVLKERLLRERDRLLQQRGPGVRAPAAAAERSAEPMDEAEAAMEQHEALGLAAHELARLQEVNHALEKLESGTYGVSEESGEPIGFARLQAVPWARLTVQEQEEAERRARTSRTY